MQGYLHNRSIAGFIVFNDADNFLRLKEILNLYRFANFNYKYSKFARLDQSHQLAIIQDMNENKNLLVDIVTYCIMPTHFHLVLKQIVEDGITKFVAKVSNSYTRYFNIRHHRKGPLWEGHFKNVLVSSDEQLLHLTRYIHLNPSSAGLVKDPFDWSYSSLQEYTDLKIHGFCDFREIIDMSPEKYMEFVSDHKDYQRQLSLIKNILIDKYFG